MEKYTPSRSKLAGFGSASSCVCRASCVVRLFEEEVRISLFLLRSCDTHVVGSAVYAYGIVCMYAVCTICTKADV